MPDDVRHTRAWQVLRARVVRDARRVDAPCELCGGPIAWGADGRRHPSAPHVDHRVPIALDPTRALDPSNLRVAHRRCNLSRGTGQPLDLRPATASRW